MNFIVALSIVILMVVVSLYNNRQRYKFTQEEWTDCYNLMLTFYKSRDRSTYKRILKLHRTHELNDQKDNMLRIWIRRVLEHNPSFNTGSPEETAIFDSEILYLELPLMVSLFKNAKASRSEVIDSMDETRVQYGATGSQIYMDYMNDAVKNLAGYL